MAPRLQSALNGALGEVETIRAERDRREIEAFEAEGGAAYRGA